MAALYVVLAGLAIGVMTGLPPSVAPAFLAAGGALAGLRRRRMVALGGILLVGAGAGGIASLPRLHGAAVAEGLAKRVTACTVEGRVVEHAGGLGTLVWIDAARCERRLYERVGSVMFDRLSADAGARIDADGWFLPLTGDTFDRARARVGAAAAFTSSSVREGPVSGAALRTAAGLRRGLRSAASSVGGREGALLLGLTIGDTSGLDPSTEERMRSAGLTHLVAVSGSNVAIVVGAVVLLFSAAAIRIRLAAAGAALMLFVLVTGPEPSVLRAAAMGGVALLAVYTGRRVHPLRALGLALVAVLALRPGLAGSAGLHLSAAATAGIVLWAGPLARRMTRLPRVAALGIAATLSAQAAVAPILIGTFGELSVTGPVANVVAMPAVAPATLLGFLSGIISVVAPGPGGAIAHLSSPFLRLILWAGDAFGSQSWAMAAAPSWLGVPLGIVVAAVALRSIRDLVSQRRGPATLQG